MLRLLMYLPLWLPALAVGQPSSLPQCPQASQYWDNCIGSRVTNYWSYIGEFRGNKRNGRGAYTFADGGKYVGEWRNDRYHGRGIRYDAGGQILQSGRWEDERLIQAFAIDAASFPFDVQASNSTSQIEAERKKRQELEERLAAETRERERLAAEARERERPPPPPPTTPASIRTAHALVIGNAAYPGSGRLDNPVNDATAISQKLRAMGFTVTTVTDANRQRLVQAMSQFRRTAASAEVSLLFYSGHGVQVFGKNYMLPTDVDQTDVAQATIQGVSLNEVVENFLPGKTKLVFLDACRDNPLQRTGDRSVSRGLAPIAVAEGTLIAYATKDGQVASDGTGQRNSPFTQALLEHLSDPSDIAVVLRKVREKVMRATGGKQQPWEYGSLTGGELVLSAIRPR
ncbi:MAG: caspase family protein [Rubrivivax sp.]